MLRASEMSLNSQQYSVWNLDIHRRIESCKLRAHTYYLFMVNAHRCELEVLFTTMGKFPTPLLYLSKTQENIGKVLPLALPRR